ncbi:endoplasmic reticulum-Golgi intermediate compartment protein 1 isoform X1 [Gopherus evgoodei]|uniref:Endoplasmic reticulum-Golgi intermediate compartment protein n=1 Tax=Gopherus evgoodei TaxID=1825980 RepID=A0A8C4WAN6_9SAUR|nr:endoplasmic reticulum-Golgi intermediate compartment protein 1 isoform X1 [Gopherus evgoodei]
MTLAVCLIFHPCPKWVLLVRTGELWRFDIYRKVPKDLTQPTYTGAIISVCCCLFILFLFLSELTGFIATEIVARCLFFDQNPRSKRDPVKSRRDEEGACSCALCGAQDGVSPSRVNELYVDDPDKESGGKIEVNLNISLPNLHCELVGLDIQDEMGRHEVGHIDNSMKVPLNNGDGCRFEGHFSINKVPGNFHVSTHSATAQPQNPDMTHIIHKLSFGDKLQVQNIHGAFNALGGADKLSSNPLASHDYILKIVPTVYEDMSGKQRYSYQYTVANKEYVAYSHTGRIIPAIWFRYDLSPITVKYTERRQPLYRFITSICAIIGGTFTVAGILDSCIFTASEAWKKIQLGKMQ